jgi:hypothetical protein
MTTPRTDRALGLAAEQFEAEVREADATLKVLKAQAEGRKAKADMDEISGLAATKERVKRNIADLKQKASSDFAATKRDVEQSIKELQAGIQRVNERYSAWDAARERQFYARLDEADARLKIWEAQTDQKRAELGMKRQGEMATLREKVSFAKARAAAAREKRSAEAQAALDDAARQLDTAYDAAAKHFDGK